MVGRRLMLGGLAATFVAGCEKAKLPGASHKRQSAPKPLRSIGNHDLVELTTFDPSIRLDLRYATAQNVTGRVLYSQARAFMQKDAAAALVRAHKRAGTDGYGLTIFDAYRPWRVTKQLWDSTPVAQHQYVANPKEGSRHNRGCAVDLTLHRLSDGAAVEMPSGFDDFSEKAHRNYWGGSQSATANRARLARYLEAEHFEGRWDEWWHFDFRDWKKHPVLDVAFEDL